MAYSQEPGMRIQILMIEVKNKVGWVNDNHAVNCNDEVGEVVQRGYGRLRIIKVIPFENLTN